MKEILEVIPLFFLDVFAIGLLWVCFRLGRRFKDKRKWLYVLCIISGSSLLINQYCLYVKSESILALLPLHLCYMAVWLIPIGLASRNTVLLDLIFYLCVPASLLALLLPSNEFIAEPYSLLTLSFFLFHFLNLAIPILASYWGVYDPAPSIKKAIRVSVTGLILTGVIHVVNLFVGAATGLRVNYFFTIIEYSAPTNPAYQFLGSLIPFDYVYLWPGLLVLYVNMGVVYAVRSYRRYRKRTSDVAS
ncbi:hypothetical protein Q73_14690 [Bacillus coahuilensis m2-6]|uniref:TMEM164 family acyltransferase n=1 Tax=Bacillus coahuilensis TaxID=408580 RepID=UPI0001850918|nr:YwaF family protein [Bacillus coahuilensis]KUP04865.1 hypothetical protein Q73_14690 [Bacillus coahuilensis m2-6]